MRALRRAATAGAPMIALLLLLGGGGMARAQAGLSADAAGEIDRAAQTARTMVQTEIGPYASLGNPQLLETKRRQAQAGADNYLAAIVQNLIARYPGQANGIVERAIAVAPESRNAIIGSGQSAAIAQRTQAGAAPSAAAGAVPSNWYGQPALQARGLGAGPPIAGQVAPAPTVATVPMSWYSQGSLSSYGAPVYQQPPLPQGTPAGPDRTQAQAQAAGGVAPAPPVGQPPPARNAGRDQAGPDIGEVYDPIEPVNRAILAFNDIVDFALLKPVATVYGYAPGFVKDGVRNVLNNLRAPVVFANDVMQLTFRDAARTFDRFIINSTIGVAGVWDPADKLFNIKRHHADFGQTMHSYGAGPGPYLVLPLFGPSNLRDGVGLAVDSVIDPWGYFLPQAFTLGRAGVTAVSKREELLDPLDELKKSSIDWYAGLRSAYNQSRAIELRKQIGGPGAAKDTKAVDDLFNTAQ